MNCSALQYARRHEMFIVDFVLTILKVSGRSRTTMTIYVKNATSYIDVGDGCWSRMLEKDAGRFCRQHIKSVTIRKSPT